MRKKLILAIACCLALTASSQTLYQLKSADCFLQNCDFGQRKMIFGYFTVPENYDRPEGRTIQIAYAIAKAINETNNSPLMYFEGGWGSPTLENIHWLTRMLSMDDRDIIYFDYRGTGFSQPKVCTWLSEVTWNNLKADKSLEETYTKQLQNFNVCFDSLSLLNIDYNQYGQNTSSRDGVKLAEALGYDEYNLLGISYGTRAIQNFIREAEDSPITIRSAILDSTVPMGIAKQGKNTINYYRTVDKILTACENDDACNKKFPELRGRFRTFLAQLDAKPIKISMKNDGAFFLNKAEFNGIMHQLLYWSGFYTSFPLVIDEVIEGNYRLFSMVLPQMKKRIATNFNFVGAVKYVYDDKVFKSESIAFYKSAVSEMPEYEVWDGHFSFLKNENMLDVDSLESVPIHTNVPALILAGSYDPATPPALSRLLRNSFSKAHYIEFSTGGHGIVPTNCGSQIVHDFLQSPDIKPEVQCIDKEADKQLTFITDYYKNERVGSLATSLLIDQNMVIAILLVFIVFVCFITFASALITFIRSRKFRLLQFACSLIILVLICTLGLYFLQTMEVNFFLLSSGLVADANYIMILSPVVIVLVSLFVVNLIKAEKRSLLSLLSCVAFLSTVAFLFAYALFPNISF